MKNFNSNIFFTPPTQVLFDWKHLWPWTEFIVLLDTLICRKRKWCNNPEKNNLSYQNQNICSDDFKLKNIFIIQFSSTQLDFIYLKNMNSINEMFLFSSNDTLFIFKHFFYYSVSFQELPLFGHSSNLPQFFQLPSSTHYLSYLYNLLQLTHFTVALNNYRRLSQHPALFVC